ncbi:MAG: bifunctional phosphoribosylaminoimidazolecarboxamide formyltransferase/IMP cyclohydrolase [Deltaproteobacteria bacterium]|nr:bifunctional phosphoribosylaminoimidazolecarboxamide formyltransferase/IMP cyclohydrolase [Deltaproteobacteria bacterium]
MKKIRRAIISVTDKTGVAEFAKELSSIGVEIISTGGTAELLTKAGINVIPISSYTGFPEMLDGRLKTLHPKIHGGILGIRSNTAHQKDMAAHGILPIDMVVVNLYAFEKTIAKRCSLEDAIENIDIGGPTMMRSAAKNYSDVAAVVDPEDYAAIIGELREKAGCLALSTRFRLAKKVFQLTARYDAAISNYLGSVPDAARIDAAKKFPDTFTVQFEKVQDLRYGENPHQSAAFYRRSCGAGKGLADAKQLQGKELSYNNILDLNAAITLAAEFHENAAVIVKHNNPCGVAESKDGLRAAYETAYSTDKTSAFGGIVGLNKKCTKDVAEALTRIFLEAVIAPGYEEDALKVFEAKKNLRVIDIGLMDGFCRGGGVNDYDMKRVSGGLLLQTVDAESASDLKTVTSRAPNERELGDLLFAWNVCRHVKSNAIILAKSGRTVGIGAGQMSRVDSTRIAFMKAKDAALDAAGSTLASDAFFPFRDNVDIAAEHGITAIIQPGGSIKDEEVIKAANDHGIAMVFTGIRHFKH